MSIKTQLDKVVYEHCGKKIKLLLQKSEAGHLYFKVEIEGQKQGYSARMESDFIDPSEVKEIMVNKVKKAENNLENNVEIEEAAKEAMKEIAEDKDTVGNWLF